ncbi:MAG: 16S rRNA (guanine(966)-N(2))-methyltransferase RsmD [Ottowia sp.]|uniref:16S rRNA (guanine(966)-N(2))-methyltransferase RsmD n=1 Tax=Ottowia sp. TaxID=1898956 RepID=UPI0039E6DAD8
MPPARLRTAPGTPREIRIIGGQWRRSRLSVPDRPGLRPTPDRVRETLFNWLGQELTGWRCVDAFAGTGALGLEAASRGAADVLLVEQDAALAAQLRQTVQRLEAAAVRVQRGDGVAALRAQAAGAADLVLLDPPFGAAELFAPALAAAAAAVRPGGWVYLEAPAPTDEEALRVLGLEPHRRLKAGAVHAHLLQRLGARHNAADHPEETSA